MMLLRRAYSYDLDSIYRLAKHSEVGMTLPRQKEILAERLVWSCNSFRSHRYPTHAYYFFVLEDTLTHQIIGTTAIFSQTHTPHFVFKMVQKDHHSPSLHLHKNHTLLKLIGEKTGKSEICTLFLEPSYRQKQNGLLLSKARFLFMANFPARFCSTVIAEIRGFFDENDHSPFWEEVIQRFLPLSLEEVQRIGTFHDKQFMRDLLPRNPIYTSLLTPKTQTLIGTPHPFARAAMHILCKEGFKHKGCIDVLDAGPIVEASLKKIRTLNKSTIQPITDICDSLEDASYLVSNTRLHFRATITPLYLKKNHCIIGKAVADALQLRRKDPLRIATLG